MRSYRYCIISRSVDISSNPAPPLTFSDPSEVALITAIQANPKSPSPIIAEGLVIIVKQNRTAVIII